MTNKPTDQPSQQGVTLREAAERAKQFAKQHIKECSAEIIEWQDTAILRDGKTRELAAICQLYSGEYDALRVAESLVHRVAMEQATLSQPPAPEHASGEAENKPVPVKPWRQRLEETAERTKEGNIHTSIEEIEDLMQAEIDDLRALLAEDKAGCIVVTKTTSGQIVAVTRQDDEGRILDVIAESEVGEDKAGGEPVAHNGDELNCVCGATWQYSNRDWELVANPQPQAEAVRVPLTEEEAHAVLSPFRYPDGAIDMDDADEQLELVRAIEAALGITGYPYAAKRDELADEYSTGLDSPPV